jgi:hypothetical protein
MKKLALFVAVATVGFLVRRIRRRPPDPGSLSLDEPQETVEEMERAAGEPVRP